MTQVMEAVDWGQVAEEAEHLVRLCGSSSTVRTFQELIEMSKSECPNLKQELRERLVAAHFPKDEGREKNRSQSINVKRG